MIAMLRGEIHSQHGAYAIVDVNGVGYEVWATNRDLLKWGSSDGEVTVFVSTQVREDAITLYGFSDMTHRTGFEIMLGVSGVGPKVALSALDAMELTSLRTAIETDDVRTLTTISGVGKKTAQRIALELKGKLPVAFEPKGASRTPTRTASNEIDPLDLALQRLGYNKTEIEQARTRIAAAGLEPDAPVAERLKAALTTLYKDRRP